MAEATFGVPLLLFGKTPPLLVGDAPPYSATFGVALLVLLQNTPTLLLFVLLIGKIPSLLFLGKTPKKSETFGVALPALLLCKSPPNLNSSPTMLLLGGKVHPSLLVEVGN